MPINIDVIVNGPLGRELQCMVILPYRCFSQSLVCNEACAGPADRLSLKGVDGKCTVLGEFACFVSKTTQSICHGVVVGGP